MTDSLRAEVVPPRRKSGWLFLLVPLTAQLAVMATCQRTEKMTVFTPPEMPKARPMSSEIHLVFRDGDHSYMHLGPDDADMAAARRTWLGKKVFVDNDCTATVTGLKIIERIASDDEDASAGEGAKVLAAELDRCDGTYARSAELPMIVVPETRPDDAELVKKAKRELLHSQVADDLTRSWQQDYNSTADWKAQAMYDIRTLRHPLTGQTWISIHAWNEAGCGEAPINVWGLFLVNADGTLTTKQLRDLGDMTKIEQIIDIEGDGELELIGRPWLGLDVMVTRTSGEELERLPLPFSGCPC